MLVKGDRANSHHGQLQVGTGVNGLSLSKIIYKMIPLHLLCV